MGVVISNIGAKIIIDCSDLLIIRLAREIELVENGIDLVCHFAFLFSGGIIKRSIVEQIRIHT